MSSSAFDGQLLTEKLTKLNNSQQSIESLSRWCVSHRKKARQIVQTWDKLFNSLPREQSISFLYLANDILQNSRRKGSEFVNEFWNVLPSSLKNVYESGDENGKRTASRLVDIWEERKVFGSRGHSLKDAMLGIDPPPQLASNGKNTIPIKIVKRDAHSVRIKLAVGGVPEKVLTAFQSVQDEHINEEDALSKCDAAVKYVGKIEEDYGNISTQGNHQGTLSVNELEKQENVLRQCVGHFENAEATRAALVSQLREALQDQESKLELIRDHLQVAQGRIELASSMRKRLTSSSVTGHVTPTTNPATEITRVMGQNTPVLPASTPHQLPISHSTMSFAPLRTTEEENKKAAAAAVVAKLAASTSSAQMLTSVLSSLVAEEAASKNGGLNSSGFSSGLLMFPLEKRQKLENQMSVSDDMSNTTYFSSLQQQKMTSMTLAQSTNLQTLPQANQIQSPFALSIPPSLPSLSPANPSANQYVQPACPISVLPYGYSANTLPPPPPLPPHMAMGMARAVPQPQQQPQSQQPPKSQSPQQQQQQPLPLANGGFYRPPGIGFYGQTHQMTTPSIPRQ